MINRRKFLESGFAASLVLLPASPTSAAEVKASDETLNVGLIGAGQQGSALIYSALNIASLRFRAVCDLWNNRREPALEFLKTYKHEARGYVDYREMLAKEKDLHAVFIATPDFAHAEQTIACLEAGRHVYCEKMMAHTLPAARAMVRAMRNTGKLLQIGYQRRSNPRYLHAFANLLQKAKLTGRTTHVNAQFCHRVTEDYGWPKRQPVPDELLRQYGYDGMHEFRNWRSFKKYGAGPFADFGAHLVDVVNWFLGAPPKAVLASAGLDFYKNRQWFDNVMAVAEYETANGPIRAFFQVLTTTSGSGNYEALLGTEGAIKISENPKWTKIYREPEAPDWEPWTKLNYLVKDSVAGAQKQEASAEPEDPNLVRSRETGQLIAYDMPVTLDQPPHQPHLENFCAAIRGQAKLNCPADVAFPIEVVVHKVNEAAAARKAIDLKAEDFVV